MSAKRSWPVPLWAKAVHNGHRRASDRQYDEKQSVGLASDNYVSKRSWRISKATSGFDQPRRRGMMESTGATASAKMGRKAGGDDGVPRRSNVGTLAEAAPACPDYVLEECLCRCAI